MRILHLISSTGYHGAENMVAELIRQLSVLGIQNHLGVFYGQQRSNKEILSIVEPYIIDGHLFPCHGKIDCRTVYLLHQYVKKNRIDIIHSHKYKTNLYSVPAVFGTKCKLVSTCHNWVGSSFNLRFYEWLDKTILGAFDTIIGVSDEVVKKLKKRMNSDKIKKVENGIDITKYYRAVEKHEAKKRLGFEGKKLVGFIGRLSSDKGVSYLLQAVKNILDNKIDIYALIVGDGEMGEMLQAESHSLGISCRTVFMGKQNDTPLIYSALDVFVLPSLKEAFPMVILEAMASGVPIVATKVGDISLIIENNISGIVVEPQNAEALAHSIKDLLMNIEKAECIAKCATDRVKKNFSSISMAEKYQKIYEKLLN